MCGRFAGSQDTDGLRKLFPIDKITCDIQPNYPVILKPGVYDTWLDPQNQDVSKLAEI